MQSRAAQSTIPSLIQLAMLCLVLCLMLLLYVLEGFSFLRPNNPNSQHILTAEVFQVFSNFHSTPLDSLQQFHILLMLILDAVAMCFMEGSHLSMCLRHCLPSLAETMAIVGKVTAEVQGWTGCFLHS